MEIFLLAPGSPQKDSYHLWLALNWGAGQVSKPSTKDNYETWDKKYVKNSCTSGVHFIFSAWYKVETTFDNLEESQAYKNVPHQKLSLFAKKHESTQLDSHYIRITMFWTMSRYFIKLSIQDAAKNVATLDEHDSLKE